MSITEALLVLERGRRWLAITGGSGSVWIDGIGPRGAIRARVRQKRGESLEQMIVRLAQKVVNEQMKPEPTHDERIAAMMGISLD